MILVGKAGSGKDTFAKMFPELRRFAFADNVKKVVSMAQYYGNEATIDYIINRTGVYDSHMEELLAYAEYHQGDSIGKQRELLQLIGDGFRNIEPDIWVDWLVSDIENAGNPPYIITDCRYENEFERFKDDISVYIEANAKIRKKRLRNYNEQFDDELLNHKSENEIDKFCEKCTYTVKNHINSLKMLRNHADAIRKTISLPSET